MGKTVAHLLYCLGQLSLPPSVGR